MIFNWNYFIFDKLTGSNIDFAVNYLSKWYYSVVIFSVK